MYIFYIYAVLVVLLRATLDLSRYNITQFSWYLSMLTSLSESDGS